MTTKPIQIETIVHAPLKKAWEVWNAPEHITNWYFAADTWHCPKATNNLKEGGKFTYRMEAKDGSMGFDFSGTYEKIDVNSGYSCVLDDGRRVGVAFADLGDRKTIITETFEPEQINSPEMQQSGWQAILNNFKRYCESVR